VGDPKSAMKEPAPAASAPATPADSSAKRFPELSKYLDVPIRIAIELGRRQVAVRDVLELRPNAVLELDKLTGEPVNLVIGDLAVARGEIVVSGESLVVRVSQILGVGEDLA